MLGAGAGKSDSARAMPPSAAARPNPAPALSTATQPTSASSTPPADSVPELWAPRAATIVDASQPTSAASLFDGDAGTGFAIEAGKSGAVRLDLGSTREIVGLGVHGAGRAKLAFFSEENGVRTPISVGGDGAIKLETDRWAQLGAAQAAKASALVVQWTALPGASATITELAVWVAGRSRQALSEAAIADRLVTELPENAVSATAVPWTASVARVTAQGSVSASFTIGLKVAPLGRTFLVYELDKKAHWTGVARSINGHVVRGGYRADAKGLGGTQVEEINAAWLKTGDNSISFQPTLLEDGRGYNINNVRLVSVPLGVDAPPAAGARTSLSDGDLSTGLGGPGVHTASLAVPADREAAFVSFYLNKPTSGTLTVSEDGGHGRRKGQVSVDLDGRPAGWQTIPVAGVIPPESALRVRVSGDRESTGLVSEMRVDWFPSLTSPTDLAVAYPLHGECQEHKTYVRGFVAGAGTVQKPQFFLDGRPIAGKVDADGSFEADVPEPASSHGKPWSFRVDVASADGGHRTRTVPVDVCVEPPKGRILGVSPPVEDVGAPYGAVVTPGKASTLSFAGATLEIPAGAVDSNVRVTIRALERGQVPPVQAEMDNVGNEGRAMRLGPHGLKFKKPIKVTLPVDAEQLPAGMTTSDVTGFYFDEGSSKWTQLPKLLVGPDRVIAQTTHFTDFIAATLRTPDHPDGQQFNPNTMKGMKVGEPGAGITLIQPPEVNSNGSARLSYPIETPPGRNGIAPRLALTYDSDRTNANGWLGVGWDLRMSSIEIDTRFGVPQYNGTETYLLDGAELVPTTTSGTTITYIRRVESTFDLIQRTGTGPTTYSWSVIDKAGTKYTYGTATGSRLANPRAGQNPNIFRWYLDKVQDLYGNVMTISYQHDNTITMPAASTAENVDGVYPLTIDYTSNTSGLTANYHVTFNLDSALNVAPTRPDITISGRPGFIEATRRRLDNIVINSGTTLVRQYKFSYYGQLAGQNLADTMQKSVLSAVALWGVLGSQSSELYRHTFEYQKAPALAGMFSAQQATPWGQVSQASPQGGFVPRTDSGLAHSSDDLIGGAVTLGGGFPEFNVTGSYGMDSGSSNPDLALFGFTGEGLLDQIDTAGTESQSSLLGTPPITNHFSARTVNGLPGLGATDRSGWTAGGNVSALSMFGVGASYGRHVSNDGSIITDINGDGFPDIVFANVGSITAYLNNGQQGFTSQTWSGYDLSNSTFSTANRVTQAGAGTADAYFKTDPLVRWVAPFTGTVTVNASTTAEGSTADQTRVDLYVVNEAVRSVTIPSGDAGANHPILTNYAKPVNAGDPIYLRVAALGSNPSLDAVDLSTSLVYTPPTGRTASELDPTGLPIFNFVQSTDLRMAGLPRSPWHLTGNGDISVTRCFGKSALPDDVLISYVLRNPNGTISRRFDKTARAMAKSAYPTLICFDSTVIAPLASDPNRGMISGVAADQTLGFEITSDSPFDPDLTDPFINDDNLMIYTNYCRSPASAACGAPQSLPNGQYTIPGDPFPAFPLSTQDIVSTGAANHPYYQTYARRIFNNNATVAQPIRSQAAPSASVTFGGSVKTTAALTEDVVVTIQGVNKLHAKVKIPKGTASGVTFPLTGAGCSVTSDCEQGRTCSAGLCSGAATVTSGEPVFFSIYSPTVNGGNVSWSPTMNGAAVSAVNINKVLQDSTFDNNAPAGNASRDPMSGAFRNWFYGDWNDLDTFSSTAIVRVTAAPQNADPAMGVVPIATDDADQWAGRGGILIIRDIPIIAVPGQVNNPVATSTSASGESALRIADTWNVDVTGSAFGVTAGVNGGDGTTQVDFFDFNGDRYPDSITSGGVLLNNGVNGFSGTRKSLDFKTELSSTSPPNEIRQILNVSLQAGVSVPTDGSGRKLINESEGDGKTKKVSASMSLSGSTDYGVSSTRIDFVDVNGDGLPDHVHQEPGDTALKVRLNLGYGFSNEMSWNTGVWNTAKSSITSGWGALTNVVPDPSTVLAVVPGIPDSTNVVRLQDTGTVGVTVGGSVGGVIGGGGGPTWSVTRKWVDMIDVNGDGLPDQVMKVPGDANLHVKLNLGTSFGLEQSWGLPAWAPPKGFDTSFSFLIPDTLGVSTINGWGKNLSFQFCYIICFGMSGYESQSYGGPSIDFEDVNGDGKVDQVMKVPGDANVYWKENNVGQTNLLMAVDRPLGGRIAITYAATGNHVDLTVNPKINMPSNQWTMASVVVDSAVLNGAKQSWNFETTEQFSYANPTSAAHNVEGFYDPVERENYGYSAAKVIYPSEDLGTSIVATYLNQDFYQHGLEQTKNWYQNDAAQTRLRMAITSYADPSGKDLTQQAARTGTFFPAESQKETFFYEAGSLSKWHIEQRSTDTAGNLSDLRDYGDGDFSDPTEYFNYHIDYQHPAANVTVPFAITQRNSLDPNIGFLLAKRTATYSPQGKPLTVTDVIANGNDPVTGTARTEGAPGLATWTYTYDAFGNVKTATSPGLSANPTCSLGTCGHKLQYTYDTTTQTYPVTTAQVDADPAQNAAYTSTALYDLRFGLPTQVIDVDGAEQQIAYDNYGRIMSAYAPSDFNSSGVLISPSTPTIGVAYSEAAHTFGATETLPANATATHRANAPNEGSLPGAVITPIAIRTVNFVDGLSRSIQVKKDMMLDNGPGLATTAGMSVSGNTTFDARGRVFTQGQPIFVAGTTAPTTFVMVASFVPTTYSYDVFGRLRQEQHPDESGQTATTGISYTVEVNPADGFLYIVKTTTDPLYQSNNAFHWRREYQTVRGDVRYRVEPNLVNGAATNLTTTYGYDQLSRLTSVTDNNENVTTASYDTVGNLVGLSSPDSGSRQWRYCVGGYVCSEIAPKAAPGTMIQYAYDRDRLKTITYPSDPSVTYAYGNTGEKGSTNGYKANRVKQRLDEAGEFDYTYDALGNTASETAILNNQVTGAKYQSYATSYTWDNFGRVVDVTIPGTTNLATPAETIRYGYDAGGNVASANGKVGLTTFPYVTHVGYNQFGERVGIKYGNGAFSTYGYTPDTRRLSNASTTVQPTGQTSGRQAQALTYQYDIDGNVLSRSQSQPFDTVVADVVPIGGTSLFNFGYDPLNQLVHADLFNQVKQSEDHRASVDITYDAIGNITNKNQTDFTDALNAQGVTTGTTTNQTTTYTFVPTYAGTSYNPSPHAASSISETRMGSTLNTPLFYDPDGNVTQGPTRAGIIWTDTDRVRSMCLGPPFQCSLISQALYAADGTRTHNKTGSTETIYVNQYLTIRNGVYPTKHVYLGDQRVASKMETNATTNSTYWYHSDNLQDAQYVTTTGQALVQHLEYFPAGEIWREENDTTKLLETAAPHATTFSGKELDSSGYYYFGARYYEPQTQIWLSTDPILGSYLKKGAARTSPKNLNLYSYSWNNPVVMRDPDGEEPVRAQAGTAADVRQTLNNSPSRVGLMKGASASEALLGFGATDGLEPKTGFFNLKGDRYVYTQGGGWMDMTHFMFYAGRAFEKKLAGNEKPVGDTIQEGYRQERMDTVTAPHSAYSYEDLPSDAAGAVFGAQAFDAKSAQSLGEQVEGFLSQLGATAPSHAPNWGALPKTDADVRNAGKPSVQNRSTTPMFTTPTKH